MLMLETVLTAPCPGRKGGGGGSLQMFECGLLGADPERAEKKNKTKIK